MNTVNAAYNIRDLSLESSSMKKKSGGLGWWHDGMIIWVYFSLVCKPVLQNLEALGNIRIESMIWLKVR